MSSLMEKKIDDPRIPADEWVAHSLGQLGSFLKGSGVRRDQAQSGNIPCVRYGEIYTTHHNIVRDFHSYISAEVSAEATRLHNGDLLFAGSGETKEEIGKCVAFVGHEEAYAGGDIIILRPKGVNSAFLGYLLNSPPVVRQKASRGQGDAVVHISAAALGSIQLELPKIDEQERIASALKDIDDLIASLDALIAKKRDIKQAAMQQLLTGKTRLPGFEQPWVKMRVSSFAPLQRGFDLPTSQLKDGPFPVAYSNGILAHHKDYMVKGPGVITGRSGTIGNITYCEKDFWPHNTSLWVTSFEKSDPKFVFYFLQHMNLARFATGSGVPTLNRNDVHAQFVEVPDSKTEQLAIANALADIDSEIDAFMEKTQKARRLREGMMQQLLTGRIRLI